MKPDRLQAMENLYNDALALPPDQRSPFLDRACADDADLRQQVASLLECERDADTFLSKSAIEMEAESLAKHGGGSMFGRVLGRYQLLSLVGRGGMGEVYCAVDTRLNRLVAIKVLPSYVASEPDWIRRFEKEARAAATLNHSHICSLYDIGQDLGRDYLVFEYLVGETLAQRLLRRALTLSESLEYAIQIAEALDDAHQRGILHRDLKPHNIMLTKSGVKLLDFGLAELKHADVTESLKTKSGPTSRLMGTLAYMAPELLQVGTSDVRTDVFGFGVLLYHMLTGRPPFGGSAVADIITSILNHNPPAISALSPLAPQALDTLVAHCLAKDPKLRCQSMSEVLATLRGIKGTVTPSGLSSPDEHAG